MIRRSDIRWKGGRRVGEMTTRVGGRGDKEKGGEMKRRVRR